LEFDDQYGEEHESEESHENEVPANYKDREKQSDLDSRKLDGRAPAGNNPCVKCMVIVNGQMETSKATLMGCMEIKKLEAVDYKVTEAGQGTRSQIYYSMPRNITLEDRLLGVYFPWELGDQEPRITVKKYWLIGVHVAWELGDQKHRYIALKLWPFGTYFLWDPGGQKLCSKLQS
jgi:hypothetical protein